MPTVTEKFSVEFTKDEAEALVKLLDVAVKSAGLPVAAQAAHFHQKVDKAYRNRVIETPIPTSNDNPK